MNTSDHDSTCFFWGRRLGLRPLTAADLGPRYLRWLNDEEVNRYSGRRFRPSSEMDMRNYLNALSGNEQVLAVCLRSDSRHIGNIKYGPIDWPNRCCEIEILLGEKSQWGRGYASEAIYLVARHLFLTLDLNRVEAKSANPAFIRAVSTHLGWTREGELRQRFRSDAGFISYFYLSQLKDEFRRIPAYEPAE